MNRTYLQMESMNSLLKPESTTFVLKRAGILSKSFELFSQDHLVGKLQFTNGMNSAKAETAEEVWIFRNTYLAAPHISIWTTRQEFVGMFESDRLGAGSLLIQDGRRLKWDKSSSIQKEWFFQNSLGEKIIKFLPAIDGNRDSGTVHIYPECFKIEKFQLFILLGWNIISVLESGRNIKLLTNKQRPW